MKNKDFLKQYVDGCVLQAAHGRMAYKDGRLISYNTVICDIDRYHKTARMNVKKYSATTSRMQSYLRYVLDRENYEVEEYEGEDAYIWDAYDARDWKVSVSDVDTAQ